MARKKVKNENEKSKARISSALKNVIKNITKSKAKKSSDKKSYNQTYKLGKKELQREIRLKTKEVNYRLKSYNEAIEKGEKERVPQVEDYIQRMKENSMYKNKKGEKVIPKSKDGEIALGLTNKNKASLQLQLFTLKRFLQGDVFTPVAEKELDEQHERAYQTFIRNRGAYMTRAEYDEAIDMMNTVKFLTKGYGYEGEGGGFADLYVNGNEKGRKNFISYVEEAKKLSKGHDVDYFRDKIAELMQEDNALI